MKLAIMQGRLSPMVNRKIQSFPIKNWKKEFSIAKKIGLKFIEWTLDYQHLFLNPLLTKKGKKEIKFFSKKYSIKIKSLTGDCFMQKPFWKLKNNNKLIKLIFFLFRMPIQMIYFLYIQCHHPTKEQVLLF